MAALIPAGRRWRRGAFRTGIGAAALDRVNPAFWLSQLIHNHYFHAPV